MKLLSIALLLSMPIKRVHQMWDFHQCICRGQLSISKIWYLDLEPTLWIAGLLPFSNKPCNLLGDDDVIKWKHFPRYRPFVRGIRRSPANSLAKVSHVELWVFRWSAPWINGWVNNRQAGDLSSLLFILVLEGLSCEFHTSVLGGSLYWSSGVHCRHPEGECISKLKAWRAGMESKGFQVNTKKNKASGL